MTTSDSSPSTLKYRAPNEVIDAYMGYRRVTDNKRFAEAIEVSGKRVLTISLSLPVEARREIERQFWYDWITRPDLSRIPPEEQQ